MFRTQRRHNPVTGKAYPWLVARHGDGQPLLLLRLRRRLRPRSSSSSPPTSLMWPSAASTATNGPNARRPRPVSTSRPSTTASSRLRGPGPPPANLPVAAAPKIDPFVRKWLARLPHPFTAADRRAGYRYDISILQAEFSLTQVLDRPLTRAGLLRAGHPRQPRHRPPRPGEPDLRPPGRQPEAANAAPRASSGPASSPRVSPPRCTSTTAGPRSSSTTRKEPPLRTETTINDTQATSTSANGCTTWPHWPRSASPPTDVSCTSNESARALGRRGRHRVPLPPCRRRRPTQPRACASATPASTPSCPPSWPSASSQRLHQPRLTRAARHPPWSATSPPGP